MDFNIPPISGGVERSAPAPRSEPAQGAGFSAQLDAAVNVSTLPASPPPSVLEDMHAAARVAGVNRGLEGLACDVFNQLIHIARKMGDPVIERSVDYVLADEITHVRMGSRWLNELTRGDAERRRRAIEFQETIDERFTLGGSRQDGHHDVVPISIAKEARKLAGFTDEEIERLIKSTQRSQVY